MNSGAAWPRFLLLLSGACTSKTITLGQAPAPSETDTAARSDASVTSDVLDAGPTASMKPDAQPPRDAGRAPIDASNADATARPVVAPQFAEPTLVLGIESDSKDDNPTLTGDLLQIYFTSTRGGNADVWTARRSDPALPFEAPTPVDVVNTDEFDSSPAVDADGRTLWVGSQRESGLGGLDIWRSRRADLDAEWGAPELASELSSAEDDIPRPVGAGGTAMPLGSRRSGEDTYLTYWAERANPEAPFDAPRLLDELVVEGASTIDAFLSTDGSQLLYVHARDDKGDLYFAPRDDGLFGPELALDSINTEADERDPWLSPDGDVQVLFFASDRGGTLQIYQAIRTN